MAWPNNKRSIDPVLQVPGMRRRRLHPQGGLDAPGQRGEEGPGPDRLPNCNGLGKLGQIDKQ